MNLERDFAAEGRAIIDANLYMVLGTADRAGRPWATPVYYAHADYREFLWVSKPEARHSRNLEAREAVSIVIFDSTVPINSGRAVYMSAAARRLDGDRAAAALAVYSRRGVSTAAASSAPATWSRRHACASTPPRRWTPSCSTRTMSGCRSPCSGVVIA